MPLSLLCDEHIPYAIIGALKGRGIDAVPVQLVGLRTAGDPEILDEARIQGRIVYTWDKDYLIFNRSAAAHSGIFYHHKDRYQWGQAIDAVHLACETLSLDEMRNRVEFL